MEEHKTTVKWAVGTKVVALYTFDGNDPEDLPFNEGDVLTITFTTDDHGWYHARRTDGKTGMIPSNYVKERRKDIEEATVAPQVPPRAEAKSIDVIHQDESQSPSTKPTKKSYENAESWYPSNSRWPPGTKLVAKFTFAGYDPEDLPFNKRDMLTIVRHTRDPEWYLGRRSDGEVGMIPAGFVQEQGEVKALPMPWFHGNLKRYQAAELLYPNKDGMFLVRESSNFPGDYTLCLCFDGYIEHYHIMCNDDMLTIDEEEVFENLHLLVEHHKVNAECLLTCLTKPVVNFGKQHYFVNKQEFVDQGWVIKKEDLKLGETIASRQFNNTFIIKGEYLGQKILVKSLEQSPKTEQQFLIKAAIMTTLRHPNVVEFIGVVLCKPLSIVTESMDRGSLLDHLHSTGSAIQKRKQVNFAIDICNGMAYIEEKKIVHRELCAAKVMVSDNGSAKLGLWRARYADSDMTVGKMRTRWTAPEALGPNAKYTNKSDMWSFGILLWEIYSCGLEPYPGMVSADVVNKVVSGHTMGVPSDCPSGICDIMHQAWEFNPESRPCFSDVKLKLSRI